MRYPVILTVAAFSLVGILGCRSPSRKETPTAPPLGCIDAGGEIPWGEGARERDEMPPIFEGRGGDRLAAEEVARHEAYRKLIERIYGVAVDAQTNINDLAAASRLVDTSLRNEIRGMSEVGTRYFDDGVVEIAVQVTLREVVEVIRRSYEAEQHDRLVSKETVENIERANRDKKIIVVGRGALRDSVGLDRIRAMRADEVMERAPVEKGPHD